MTQENTNMGRQKIIDPVQLLRTGKMKGFEYSYPERQAEHVSMESSFRGVVERYGYTQIEGPILQPIEFYTVKSSDELLENSYRFSDVDKKVLILRPELTPTLAYMIAKAETTLTFPLRWWSNPVIFRKENPQRGRRRQFRQLNVDFCDVLDTDRDPTFADAEVVNISIEIFKAFGLNEDDIIVKVNSRALMGKLFDLMELEESQRKDLLVLIDTSEKIPPPVFTKRLKSLVPDTNAQNLLNCWLQTNDLLSISNHPQLSSLSETKEYEDLLQFFRLLDIYGVSEYGQFAPNIVRGLGYYTGTVFEVFNRDPKLGGGRSLMGGGRYDNLTSIMGGRKNITAVGFGLGQVPLEEALKARGIGVNTQQYLVDYYIVLQSASQRMDALQFAEKIRAQGKKVIVDETVSKRDLDKIGKQLTRATRNRARYAILIFPQEWEQQTVMVKELESGEQSSVNINDFE